MPTATESIRAFPEIDTEGHDPEAILDWECDDHSGDDSAASPEAEGAPLECSNDLRDGPAAPTTSTATAERPTVASDELDPPNEPMLIEFPEEGVSSGIEKHDGEENCLDPAEEASRKRMTEFLDRLRVTRERVESLRVRVAEESVVVHRLKEQHKTAKDALQESTEELSLAERDLSDLESDWENDAWMASPTIMNVPPSRDQAVDKAVDEKDENSGLQSVAIDPATTTSLSELGITPGRLEAIRQAVVPGGGTRLCSTVADLESLCRDGQLQSLKGFGPKAIEAVTDRLMEWRKRNPMPEGVVEQVSPVELIDGKWEPAAFTSGKIAYADGKQVGENPHLISGLARDSWSAGWQAKQSEHQRMSDASAGDVPGVTSGVAVESTTVLESLDTDGPRKSKRRHGTKGRTSPVASRSRTPAMTSTTTPIGIVNNDSDSTGGLIEIPDDLDLDLSDPKQVDAYRLGCEAAIEDRSNSENPHQRGTLLWCLWDRGWQDCFTGNDNLEECQE